MIQEIIKKYKNRVGRKPIAKIIFKEYGCIYSDRQIGKIMVKNNWKYTICVARKQKEFKDTTVSIKDIVLRDYDNLKHDNEIYATDVTYIPATKDCNQNHVYLSTVISHKTKEILGWKLSKMNDTFLVLDSFKNNAQHHDKNVIVHSDNGGAYSSLLSTKMLNSNIGNNHCKESETR